MKDKIEKFDGTVVNAVLGNLIIFNRRTKEFSCSKSVEGAPYTWYENGSETKIVFQGEADQKGNIFNFAKTLAATINPDMTTSDPFYATGLITFQLLKGLKKPSNE